LQNPINTHGKSELGERKKRQKNNEKKAKCEGSRS